MSENVTDYEEAQPSSEAWSRFDDGLLLASLGLTVAGGVAPEHSKAQYGLLGLATLAYIKLAITARRTGQPSQDVPEAHQLDSSGTL